MQSCIGAEILRTGRATTKELGGQNLIYWIHSQDSGASNFKYLVTPFQWIICLQGFFLSGILEFAVYRLFHLHGYHLSDFWYSSSPFSKYLLIYYTYIFFVSILIFFEKIFRVSFGWLLCFLKSTSASGV